MQIVIQDYEYNKKKYVQIENGLRCLLGGVATIDHVGSTAIPNMYGKNIIDILIGVKNNNDFINVKNVLMGMGYHLSEKSATNIYQFFASRKEETGSGDIHIHLVIKDTDRYKEFLILRDYLLKNPEEAKMYSDFKLEIITKNLIREEYKKYKSGYVTKLLERAKKYFK